MFSSIKIYNWVVILYINSIFSFGEVLVDNSPGFSEISHACDPHPDDKSLVSQILPLVLPPGTRAIRKQIRDICVPCDSLWINLKFLGRVSQIIQSEGIIEITLSDQPTRVGWSFWIQKGLPILGELPAQILISHNRMSVCIQVIYRQLVPSKLSVTPASDIPPMVLEKIV